MMNFKVNVYTYKGEYAYSYKIEYFMRDFAWMDNLLLIIQPCINKVYKRNGVLALQADRKTRIFAVRA